jgi:predicted GIY-YIG superfamily endonuclease
MPKHPLPAPGEAGEVYLIHLDKPIAHARHYIGWTASEPARTARHANGNGARLLAVAKDHGISWRVVRTWPGASKRFERRLKNAANAPRLCPVCNADGWDRQIPETSESARRKKGRRSR